MPDASFLHDSFLGGEWSLYAQGRMSHPKYGTAMALCLNAYPVEEGACPRRPGFAFCCPTRNGGTAKIVPFNFTDVAPFEIELTAGFLRVLQGRGLVFDSVVHVTQITTATPAVVSIDQPQTWATGDQVQFLFNSVTTPDQCAVLRNRQFAVTKIGTTGQLFSLTDPITGLAVPGAGLGFSPDTVQLQLARVYTAATPYLSSELQQVRRVQAANVGPLSQNLALLLHKNHQPQALQGTLATTGPNFSTFSLTTADFHDGPYLDPVVGAVMTPSALSGNIQLTLSYQPWSSTQAYGIGDFVTFGGFAWESLSETNVNNQPQVGSAFWVQTNAGGAAGPNGFQQTDIGRQIRLLSEPAAWNNATNYTVGTAVKFNNAYYIAQSANSAIEPDTNIVVWLPTSSPTVFTWTWGKITSVLASNIVTIQLFAANLLYTQPIVTWRLGAYSNTTGWPSCGCYHEGRLWLAGAIPNRFDASNANDFFNFAPTAPDGTVGDANSIAAYMNSDDANQIYWLEESSQGIMAGTRDGEWLIHASALNDPLTPATVQAHRQTKVGCFNQVPAKTPLTLVLIHRNNRMLFELFPDVFSGRLAAPNLNAFSKHLTAAGVQELAYMAENTPIVWARMGDGSLKGWTYRRVTSYSSEEPAFVGGHRHVLGGGRTIESICVAPSPDQTYDSLYMVANDPATGVRHVLSSVKLMDETDPLTTAMFLDDAVTPAGVVPSATGVTIFGLWHLNGKTVSAVIGGLDCGDYVVANGSIVVPFQSDPGHLFTLAFLQSLNGGSYGDLATTLTQSATVTPPINTAQTISELVLPQSHVTGQVNGGGTTPSAVNFGTATAVFSGANGFRNVNVVTGEQAGEVTLTALFAQPILAALGTVQVANNWTLGIDGLFYAQVGAANTDPVVKIDPNTWTVLSAFGVSGSGFTPDATHMPFASGRFGMVGVQTGFQATRANYLVCAPLLSGSSTGIAVLNTDTMAYFPGNGFGANNFYGPVVQERSLQLVAGHQGLDYATVYALGQMFPSPTLPSTHLHEVTITPGNGITTQASWTARQVGAITAQQIDPSWPNLQFIVGPMRDPTDGNLIAFFGTNLVGSSPAYIVKFNPVDASIIWKTPLVHGSSDMPTADALANSRTTGGLFSWVGGGANPLLYLVNLATGQANTSSLPGASPALQFFDSVNGVITSFGSYISGSGGFNPAPGTPTGAITSQWVQLGLGSAFQGSSSSTSSGGLPAVIGLTYTTQGQVLRPASGQEAGAANGPAFAKTRRQHMFGALLAGAIYGAIAFGTSFAKLRGAFFKSPGGNSSPTNSLFQGIYWHTIEDDYSFDSQLAWQITRPLPGTVVAIGGFINTQDR